MCIENLDKGGERKRKIYTPLYRNEPDFNLKTFFEKKGGNELFGLGLESWDDVPELGPRVAHGSHRNAEVLVNAGLVLFVEDRPGESEDGGDHEKCEKVESSSNVAHSPADEEKLDRSEHVLHEDEVPGFDETPIDVFHSQFGVLLHALFVQFHVHVEKLLERVALLLAGDEAHDPLERLQQVGDGQHGHEHVRGDQEERGGAEGEHGEQEDGHDHRRRGDVPPVQQVDSFLLVGGDDVVQVGVGQNLHHLSHGRGLFLAWFNVLCHFSNFLHYRWLFLHLFG